MPRYLRHHLPGATYFFTVALEDRGSTLLTSNIDRFRAAYADVQRRLPFESIAAVVLPDHVHALWRLPEEDGDFSERWRQIKRLFSLGFDADASRSASKATKREKGIWQRRFWEHQIRDERDLAAHVDYIHYNPVKHGHAAAVRDWPHSSFHRWVERGLLPAAWGMVSAPEGRFGERE